MFLKGKYQKFIYGVEDCPWVFDQACGYHGICKKLEMSEKCIDLKSPFLRYFYFINFTCSATRLASLGLDFLSSNSFKMIG